VDRERAGEVSHHHERSIEHADEQQVLACVFAVYLGGELGDAAGEFLFGYQDAGQVTVELGVVHEAQPATGSTVPRTGQLRCY
jgi:hypothetical protein